MEDVVQKGSIMRSLTSMKATIAATAAASVFLSASVFAQENTEMTAKDVLTNFSVAERVAFLSGVVEGLAYARYVADGKKTEGMKCVYDWFWTDTAVLETIRTAFERWPDYRPGPVVGFLVDEACPR